LHSLEEGFIYAEITNSFTMQMQSKVKTMPVYLCVEGKDHDPLKVWL